MFKRCIFILIVVCLVHSIQSFNYCSGKNATALCRKYKHFMCDIQSIPILDKYLVHVPLSRKVRDFILDTHNKLRAKIANGEDTNQAGTAFPIATRLREFVWNKELAAIAKVHASRCRMQHDKCHNTVQFKHSGQNLAFRSNGDTLPTIELMIKAWYNEKDLVADPTTYVDKLTSDYHGTGHFSVMITEKNGHLGCSVALCEDASSQDMSTLYITCNYGFTNMMGNIIYTKGDEAASGCDKWRTGKSSKYPGLCANNGEVIE